ncbi:unnamed protein product [Mytilus edulis]|uniref:Uncharacterized protein n=1 Tax=Mytilus edulis TaxID=6550 RepID=A0A8S3T0A0_MYTED|nr:unnamed protein product [Mytilus edulis]
MVDCRICDKEIRTDNLERHMRTHNSSKKIVGKKDTVKRESGGSNFFITFSSHVKTILSERFVDLLDDIKQYIICDETGLTDNAHSHLCIVMKTKYTFTAFHAWWEIHELPKYRDIESCKNLRQCWKYCSKEDHLCEAYAVDGDYLHPHTQSYLCSLRYGKITDETYFIVEWLVYREENLKIGLNIGIIKDLYRK